MFIVCWGYMFFGAEAFNRDLSSWNVAKVSDMTCMFANAKAFNGDVSTWAVSNVTTMQGMFHGAQAFNRDLSGWNVASVRDMSGMFHGARHRSTSTAPATTLTPMLAAAKKTLTYTLYVLHEIIVSR